MIALINPKFELLFESGILALQDGYYREAVTSFAASLERFYEFLLTAFMLPGIRQNKRGFQQAWKQISNSSERQFGAVNTLYFQLFSRPMPALDIAFVKQHHLNLDGKEPSNFRNIAVHQGYIPARVYAIHYGEAINKYIGHILTELSVTNEWKSRLLDTISYGVESTYDVNGNMTIPTCGNAYFLQAASYITSVETGPPFGHSFPYNPSLIEFID
jgi:hypothetical protein